MTQNAGDVDVKHIASLARVEISPEQTARFQSEIGDILAYVNELSEVDVTGVEPTAHLIPLENVYRDDVPRRIDPAMRKRILSNAHKISGTELIRVPVILAEEEC